MTTRERILMIRLVEKIRNHPAYAEALGIGFVGFENRHREESKDICKF